MRHFGRNSKQNNNLSPQISALANRITELECRIMLANRVLTDLASLFSACNTGISFFITNANSTQLPAMTSDWMYAQGFVIKRNADEGVIVLFSITTCKIAIDSVAGSQWSGWQIK